MKDISQSVGKDGVNATDDVFMVQMLLNQVSAEAGGPVATLEVDGLVGPKTISAISRFQQRHLGFQDGLVEPGRNTIKRLNDYFREPDAFSDGGQMVVAGGGGAVPPAHRLVYRDVRLHGWRPRGDSVIEVDFDTPILWFITSSASDADQAGSAGKRVRLRIMAHGYTGPGGSQGGGGVQFCREDINLGTLNLLAPLHGKFTDGVDLYACGVAFITPGYEGRSGDGNVLCSRLAQILGTYVRASTATQRYSLGTEPTGLDFGRWEGTVLTYGPRGDVVNVEHAPAM
jgi:hypothetical protein